MSEVIAFKDYRFEPRQLVQEANHRIANQLTMVVGMIQARIASARKGPQLLPREEVVDMLREAAAKVIAIAHLNHRLSADVDGGAIDLAALLIESQKQLISSLSLGDRLSIVQKLGGGCVVSADQASTLTLIASEIVMNSVKYAHPTGIPVEISIVCTPLPDGGSLLVIGDDGVGLPEGFDEGRDAGVGFKLIRSLVQKIGARLDIETDDLGVSFRIALPPQSRPRPAPEDAFEGIPNDEKVARYRQMAAESEKNAQETEDPETRRTYLDLVRQWTLLADEIADRNKARELASPPGSLH